MTEPQGLVFDIQGHSVHDGPGCRTLVFLSGCPLRCEWCANPEGMEMRPTLMFRAAKCKRKDYDCTRCVRACPHGAVQVNPDPDSTEYLTIDRTFCKECDTFDCVKACAHESLALAGKWMSASELMRIISRDRQYWGGGGGVTFTGGEPLLQRDFIRTMLKKCRDAYIHTAIETSACVDTDHFLQTMQYVDFAFIDVKHMDPEAHKAKTRVSNELTHRNIRALIASGWKGRLVLRMPIIEDFNDTVENMAATADFMNELGLYEVNILPFHRMADSKWSQLGKVYAYRDKEATPMDRMTKLQQVFLDKDVACYVGSDTPF